MSFFSHKPLLAFLGVALVSIPHLSGQALYDSAGALRSLGQDYGYSLNADSELTSLVIGSGGSEFGRGDSPHLVLSSSIGAEEDEVVVVTLTLSKVTESPVYLDYETQDATAVAGEDYLSKAGSLLFSPGETVKEVSVSLIDDTILEDVEELRITISNLTNGVDLVGADYSIFVSSEEQIPLLIEVERLVPQTHSIPSEIADRGGVSDFAFDDSNFYFGHGGYTVNGASSLSRSDGTTDFRAFGVGGGTQIEPVENRFAISSPLHQYSWAGLYAGSGYVSLVEKGSLEDYRSVQDYSPPADTGGQGFGWEVIYDDRYLVVNASGIGLQRQRPQEIIAYELQDYNLPSERFVEVLELVGHTSTQGRFVSALDVSGSEILLNYAEVRDPTTLQLEHSVTELRALDTGEVIWRIVGEYPASEVAIAGRTVVLRLRGNTAFLDRETGSLLFEVPTEAGSSNNLEKTANLIFLRQGEGYGVFNGLTRRWEAYCELPEIKSEIYVEMFEDEVGISFREFGVLGGEQRVFTFDLGLNELGPFFDKTSVEEGDPGNLVLSISELPQGKEMWEVRYEVESLSAHEGSDFSGQLNGEFLFTESAKILNLPITITSDSFPEEDESFLVRLFDVESGLELRSQEIVIKDTQFRYRITERIKADMTNIGILDSQLGYAVTCDETHVIASSGRALGTLASDGGVMVFQKSDLRLVGRLDRPATTSITNFGKSLATDGNSFFVSSPGSQPGAVSRYHDGSYSLPFQWSAGLRDSSLSSGVDAEFGASILRLDSGSFFGAPGASEGRGFVWRGTNRRVSFPAELSRSRFGELLCGEGDRFFSKVLEGEKTNVVAFSTVDDSMLFEETIYESDPSEFRVSSMACEGDWLVIGSARDREAKVYHASTGELLRVLRPVVGTVVFFGSAVAIHNGVAAIRGTHSEVGGAYGVVSLFDLSTGQQIGEIVEGSYVTNVRGSGPEGLHFDEDGLFIGWMYQSVNAVRSGALEKIVFEKLSEVFPVSVQVSPQGSGVIHGEGAYRQGEEAILNSHAHSGFKFSHWERNGEIVETPSLVLHAEPEDDVIAHFEHVNYPAGYTDTILTQIGDGVTLEELDGGFDFDGDGRSNLAEFFEGTNAADASSRFEFVISKIDYTDQDIRIECDTVEGFDYWLEWSPNLVDWYSAMGEGEKSLGTGEVLGFRVSRGNETRRYYRIASSHELDLLEF